MRNMTDQVFLDVLFTIFADFATKERNFFGNFLTTFFEGLIHNLTNGR